jgi:hypothetical protein
MEMARPSGFEVERFPIFFSLGLWPGVVYPALEAFLGETDPRAKPGAAFRDWRRG